jgi:hypothetical protein
VDDLIILSKGIKEIEEIKDQLRDEFEMKDLGELKYFLGIQVQRDRQAQTITINQHGYINMILKRFGMSESNAVSTPIATGTKLIKAMEDNELVDPKQYQSIVGSQMYAMLCTRPDIAFGVSMVSQFNSEPTSTHEAVTKRILRYLNGTKDWGITFQGNVGLKLEAYSDADHGAGHDRRSILGYIFLLAGAAITWSSKKQTTVALSSTEAEYMALLQAAKEIIWIQRLLSDLGREARDQDLIHEDNQGAIALAHNPEYHARTKHIDIQYHFIRECIENGKIRLQYCPTVEMIADLLTKPLAKDRHLNLTFKMGIGPIPETLHHHHSETQRRKPQKVGVMEYSEPSVQYGVRT